MNNIKKSDTTSNGNESQLVNWWNDISKLEKFLAMIIIILPAIIWTIILYMSELSSKYSGILYLYIDKSIFVFSSIMIAFFLNLYLFSNTWNYHYKGRKVALMWILIFYIYLIWGIFIIYPLQSNKESSDKFKQNNIINNQKIMSEQLWKQNIEIRLIKQEIATLNKRLKVNLRN